MLCVVVCVCIVVCMEMWRWTGDLGVVAQGTDKLFRYLAGRADRDVLRTD